MNRKLIAESLGRCRNGHVHAWSNLMSRRQFARTATGIAAVGAAFGLGIPKAAASAPGDPLPIPGGDPNAAPFHVFGSASLISTGRFSAQTERRARLSRFR